MTTIERVLDTDLEGCLLVEGLENGKGGSGDLATVRHLVKRLGGTVTELRS